MPHNPYGQKWIRNEKRCAIYARDDFRCVYCLTRGRLVLDHVDPCGGNECDNLVSACPECNGDKACRPLEAWLAIRETRGEPLEHLRAMRQRVALATFLHPDLQLGKKLEALRPRGSFTRLPRILERLERQVSHERPRERQATRVRQRCEGDRLTRDLALEAPMG